MTPLHEPIKILDTNEFETTEDSLYRTDIIEQNFKECINSWMGTGLEIIGDYNAESEDELDGKDM